MIEVVRETEPVPVRYVALGDSSAEGLADPDGNGGFIGWATRLAWAMADVHGRVAYANLAVRGYDTNRILATQLADAVALKPTVATVTGGMNDLLHLTRPVDAAIADLATMQRTLVAAGARVATVTLPDPSVALPITRLLRRRVHQFNDGIRGLAGDGVVVADLAAHPLAGDRDMWHDDRLHANTQGHRHIARALAEVLGLPFQDGPWPVGDNLPTCERASNRQWRSDHLVPWVKRRIRGVSSGDGLVPRHSEYVVIDAAPATA